MQPHAPRCALQAMSMAAATGARPAAAASPPAAAADEGARAAPAAHLLVAEGAALQQVVAVVPDARVVGQHTLLHEGHHTQDGCHVVGVHPVLEQAALTVAAEVAPVVLRHVGHGGVQRRVGVEGPKLPGRAQVARVHHARGQGADAEGDALVPTRAQVSGWAAGIARPLGMRRPARGAASGRRPAGGRELPLACAVAAHLNVVPCGSG
jgi:hypothetical protein